MCIIKSHLDDFYKIREERRVLSEQNYEAIRMIEAKYILKLC